MTKEERNKNAETNECVSRGDEARMRFITTMLARLPRCCAYPMIDGKGKGHEKKDRPSTGEPAVLDQRVLLPCLTKIETWAEAGTTGEDQRVGTTP